MSFLKTKGQKMPKDDLEEVVRSDAKLTTSLNTLQDLHGEDSSEEIRNFALNHPSIKQLKKNGKLPPKFYEAIKRNSEYLASNPQFRRVQTAGSVSDITNYVQDDVRAKRLIYDNVPGRFYPYKEALKEGGKALLKLSPFAIGGYFINRSLANPISSIATGKNALKYLIPFYGPAALAKDVAITAAKLVPSLIWNTVKTPFMYLGGLYVLYKTVKGFLKGHGKRSETKKIASRAQLEDIASEVGKRRRYLEDKLMGNGGVIAA